MALPGVQFQISADVIRLRQDLDKAQAQIDAFARAGGTAIGTLREAFIGLGSAVTLGALIAGIKGSIDTLDALGDASQATGASIENLSKTQKVAAAYGHDFASVQAAVSRAVQGMIDPASSGAHALQALGISGKTAAGGLRDPIDVLLDVARNLGQYQDSAEKVALVTDLLGRNGAALLPMLNDMADHFDEVGAASAATSQQAQDFNDSVGRLQQQVRDLGQDVATQLLPSLSDSVALLGSMGSAADTTRGQTTGLQAAMTAFNVVLETAIVLGRNVAYVFEQTGNEIGGIAAQIGAVLHGNFGDVSVIHQQMQADAAAARQKLDMLDDLTLKTREYQQAQRDLANTSDPRFDKQYTSGASKLSYTGDAETKARAAAAKAAAQKALADAKAAAQQFEQLQAQIMGKGADVEAKFYDNLRLIATQGAKVGMSLQQVIDLQGKYIAQQPFAIAQEKAKQAAIEATAKANTQAVDEMIAAQDKAYAANEQQIKSAREYLDNINDQTQALMMNKNALAELNARRALERAGVVEGTQAYTAYMEKIRQAVIDQQTVQESIDAQQRITDYWKQATAQINQSLTDALMQGFESGKGFAQSFRDAIKSLFSTLVLRPVVQMAMSPVSSGMAGLLGGPAAAQAGGMTDGVNWLSTGSSLYSNLTGGGLVGALAGSSAAYGAAIGGGSLAAGSQAAMLAAQTGVFGSAGLSATASAAGGMAGSAMTGLATVAPYLAAAVAIYMLATSMSGGETRQGGQYGIGDILRNNHGVGTAQSLSGLTLLSNPSGGEIAGSFVQTSITQTIDGINQLLKSTGSQAVVQGFQAGLESSSEGRGGVYAGGTLSTGSTFGLSGLGDNYNGTLYDKAFSTSPDSKTALENFSAELLQTTVQALQAATDVPKFVRDQLTGVDAKSLTADTATALITGIQQQVDSINAFNAAMQTLPFAGLTSLSLDAAAALGQAVGGIANLANMASSLQSFANNTAFYTQSEIDSRDKANLQATLSAYGMSLPATTAGYRALVEQATAEAGAGNANSAQALQGLLANADTFARIVSDAIAPAMTFGAVGGGGVGGGGGSSALSAWQSATDAIVSTMKDLRTTLLGSGAQSLAQLQAQFTIASAQAKAGDLTAAQNLPQLAKDLVSAGHDWSATATDQARLTSTVLASLSQVLGARGVAIPAFASGGLASGWALVGEQGPELAHFGDTARIYTAGQTRAALQGGDTAAELRALRQELAALRAENGAENRAIVTAATRTQKLLERVAPDGDALAVRTAS